MTESFDKIIQQFKNLKVTSECSSVYLNNIKKLMSMKNLMSLLERNYEDSIQVKIATNGLVNNLKTLLESGKKFKKNNDSITEYLKHHLLQFSTMNSIDEETKQIKNISNEIMNDYVTFLFICDVIDQDFLFSGIIKFLINDLVSKLLSKKIFIVIFNK